MDTHRGEARTHAPTHKYARERTPVNSWVRTGALRSGRRRKGKTKCQWILRACVQCMAAVVVRLCGDRPDKHPTINSPVRDRCVSQAWNDRINNSTMWRTHPSWADRQCSACHLFICLFVSRVWDYMNPSPSYVHVWSSAQWAVE